MRQNLHEHVTRNVGVPYYSCLMTPGEVGFILWVLNFFSKRILEQTGHSNESLKTILLEFQSKITG